MLPEEKKAYIINKYKISEKETEILCRDKALLKMFEDVTEINQNPQITLNWLLGECMHLVNLRNITWKEVVFSAKNLAELIALSQNKDISMQTAKEVLEKMFDEVFDVFDYVEKNNLKLNSDDSVLESTAKKVISENEKSVGDYFAGKDRALQFLIGQGMKHLKGRADVKKLSDCIKDELERISK